MYNCCQNILLLWKEQNGAHNYWSPLKAEKLQTSWSQSKEDWGQTTRRYAGQETYEARDKWQGSLLTFFLGCQESFQSPRDWIPQHPPVLVPLPLPSYMEGLPACLPMSGANPSVPICFDLPRGHSSNILHPLAPQQLIWCSGNLPPWLLLETSSNAWML